MKQLTTYNRVAGYLNKIFDLLNEHYFQGELARPTITIQSNLSSLRSCEAFLRSFPSVFIAVPEEDVRATLVEAIDEYVPGLRILLPRDGAFGNLVRNSVPQAEVKRNRWPMKHG